jgi:RNA polymerase sigma factor (sigma-70 family)
VNLDGSVSCWLSPLREGDDAAIQQLWERYFARLVRLARTRLQGPPRRVADEEDVALSAFASFCRRAEEGQFPQLTDRDGLWKLLATIADRKAANLVRHEQAQKRGGARERVEADLREVLAREPDPAFAAEVAEQCRHLLELLPDDLRRVAVWKLEGHSNEEIAALLDRSLGTVERRLRDIRRFWDPEGVNG